MTVHEVRVEPSSVAEPHVFDCAVTEFAVARNRRVIEDIAGIASQRGTLRKKNPPGRKLQRPVSEG